MDRRIRKLIKEQDMDKRSWIIRHQIINPLKRTHWGVTLKDRAMLSLKVCGFTYAEIAQVFDTTTAYVKKRLLKNRQKLSIPIDYRL